MTIDKLQAVLHANPFQPFTIHMADGRRIHVPNRDFIAHSPSGRTAVVEHEDDSHSILDLLLITELEIGASRADRKNGRKRSSE